MFVAVPEGVAEAEVVLDGDWVDGRVDFEAAFLEHHHRGVVDAGAFGEDEDWLVGLLNDVFAHLSGN